MKLTEIHTESLKKLVAGMFHIMLIISIVDYPLKVTLVIAHLHLVHKDIIFLIHNFKINIRPDAAWLTTGTYKYKKYKLRKSILHIRLFFAKFEG